MINKVRKLVAKLSLLFHQVFKDQTLSGGIMLQNRPLGIEIYWHPKSEEECKPLALEVYKALNRETVDYAQIGLDIPVYLYNNLDFQNRSEQPDLLLRIVLVTGHLVLSEEWDNQLDAFQKDDDASKGTRITVQIGLSEGLIKGDRLGCDFSDSFTPKNDLIDTVLFQCCRLFFGRAIHTSDCKGATPLKLFISHTKHDNIGKKLAIEIENAMRTNRVATFFDAYDIQPASSLTGTLIGNIQDSALLVVRTDRYFSRYWCRKEVAEAKKNRRPIVVVDAMENSEGRSSWLLTNLPTIRLNPKDSNSEELRKITRFVGLEVLRYLHNEKRMERWEKTKIFPDDAKFIGRPPELIDLVTTRNEDEVAGNENTLVYPDPVISNEELYGASELNLSLITPTEMWKKNLSGISIGLSIGMVSEDEIENFGISELHITDASLNIARVLLASGANLYYGGKIELEGPDKKGENLVSALIEMIASFDRNDENLPPLHDFSAWPFWTDKYTNWVAKHKEFLKLEKLDAPDGAEFFKNMSQEEIFELSCGLAYTAISLTEMREIISNEIGATVVLGGATHNFKGKMPGIIEESLLAIDRKLPLYIIGGYGGAAFELTRALNKQSPYLFDLSWQEKKNPIYREVLVNLEKINGGKAVNYPDILKQLQNFGVKGISECNGLTEEENQKLWETRDLEFAIGLIMTGLKNKGMKIEGKGQ